MLYSLQILNTLVSVNNQVLTDVEIQERYEWRQSFLELGGFTYLYMILIDSDISDMIAPVTAVNSNVAQTDASTVSKKQKASQKKSRTKLTVKSSSALSYPEAEEDKKPQLIRQQQGIQTDQARCMSFLISIVKIFLHAALLTVDYENLLNLVVQSSTSPFRSDRKKEPSSRGPPQLEQLVTQGLNEKANKNVGQGVQNSYGRESDAGSRAGNTSGTGTPKFGSD